MSDNRAVPDDFPRDLWLGTVSGYQPKVLARREKDGRYVAGLTECELSTRYEACEDLAHQLAVYTAQKISELGWSLDDALGRVETSVLRKVTGGRWDFSAAEVAWTMKRTRELLSPQPTYIKPPDIS
ncbi:hypothetical protein M3I54_25045 [Paraburkholderia sp. CNPSo 3274]|uniref:hypothetical protein n=1 Tax=Paraburkholderia sp. CNPSo 3274 TaxID=2940932 RepID=UPI0020B8C9D8|nr:hypothetical protein [Paraburkholderia sp. CNPSo 3274]MCP3710193.1 hypothetical protein [Paraburkholderia sp. CNPSo 3274]